MREQRKNNYNRKLAWKLHDIQIDELKFSIATDDDIHRWMSPIKQADI